MTNEVNGGVQQTETVSGGNSKENDVAFMELKKEKLQWKERYEEISEKLKSLERDKQSKEGDKDGVIESLRTELKQAKDTIANTNRTYAQSVLSAQIRTAAVSEGCINPDKLIRLLSVDDLKTVEVGENFTVNSEDLKRLIDKAKKDHADIGLFKKTDIKIHDVTSSKTIPDSQKKNVSIMNSNELSGALANILSSKYK